MPADSGRSDGGTCGHAGFTVLEGVHNQALEQPERLNGVGQTANAVHGVRDGAHVKRGFNEISQRNILDLGGLKGGLQGSLLRLRDFLLLAFLGAFALTSVTDIVNTSLIDYCPALRRIRLRQGTSFLLLFTDAVASDVTVEPYPGIRFKIPRAPHHLAIPTDNEAKVCPLVILNGDIVKLRRHGFSLFAGEVVIR